jgi:tetratricopeptide (TPR) repeat protein
MAEPHARRISVARSSVRTASGMFVVALSIAFALMFVWVSARADAATSQASDSPGVDLARQARDAADAAGLQKLIQSATADASKSPGAEAQLHDVALYNHWLVEIAGDLNDKALEKSAAFAGRAAAEQAATAKPGSSEAHAMLGLLLGDCIPHTSMGGMRLGPRAQKEFEKALEIDSLNVDAYIGQGIGKLMTPSTFGGSPAKAIEFFHKAVEIDPSSDTPHIWLALAYQKQGDRNHALEEITRALDLNPNRRWSQITKPQIEKMK